MIKISFLALSGQGKTTAAKYISKKYNAKIIRLSDPLYEIQNDIYCKIGLKKGKWIQDGELLQFLGYKVQTIEPKYLSSEFLRKLKKAKKSGIKIVINDDCRPHNHSALKKAGFKFVGIKGPIRTRNSDITKLKDNHKVEWKKNEIVVDEVIENTGSLKAYYENIDSLMSKYVVNGKQN